ncbi:NACHT domain-containing protein [Catenulispora subtropica]|uniref:NACHT domain-containing protein n=1 Tax=Catenulispora subtropica TaxID=450798 RepID=A0ABP5E3Y3_9ACTN
MSFTGTELAALKKAAALVGKAVFTGPGPGARVVEDPIRVSRIPVIERRKAALESEDLELFAREVLKRTPELDPDDGRRVVEAFGALVLGLPYSCVDMKLMLDLRMRPEGLRDALLAVFPTIRRTVGDDLEPALRELADAACPHIVEFFTRRENYSAAAITHLVAQGGDRFPEDQVSALLADYAVLVRKKFNMMRLFGMDLGPADRAIDLMTGFVDLTVESSEAPGRGDGGAAPRRVEWSRMGALVEERQRVLLEGPAGAGKSTLLQHLTLGGIEAFAPDGRPAASGAGPTVPFLLRLREFVKDGALTLPNVDDLLSTLAPGLAGLMPGWERALLKTGNAAVYVDGVDEIPESLRPLALDWITDLVAIHPFARLVVTSRAAGVDEQWRRELRRAGFTSAVINPMSTAQVATFVERWHQAALLQWGDSDPALQDGTADLMQAVQSRRDLARIATTPLLCAMICALYYSDNGVLPQNRTALYERAFAMFFEKRDSHNKIKTFPVHLSREQVERFLAEFALWMLLERRRNIPRSVALAKVAGILPTLRFRGAWTPEAEDLLKYLIERCGVLQEPTMDELEFRHPSFQDYLAAKRVLQEEHYNLLIDNAHDALYQDVLMMAVGQAQSNSKVQGRLLEGLLRRCDIEMEEVARQLSLLALACIADVGMVDPQWTAAIQHRTKELLPPRDNAEARTVAVGPFVLDLLADVAKRPERLRPEEAAATVQAARLIDPDDPTARVIMRQIARHGDHDVRNELIAAWHESKDPAVFHKQILEPVDFRAEPLTVLRPQLLPMVKTLRNVELLTVLGLSAADCAHMAAIDHLWGVQLIDPDLPDLAILAEAPQLRQLTFASHRSGALARLADAENITVLSCRFGTGLSQDAFNGLANIARLKLSDEVEITLISLAHLPKLEAVELGGRYIGALGDLAYVPNVTRLRLSGSANLHVDDLARSETLTHLSIHRHLALNIEAIAATPRLAELDLPGDAVVDLRPLAESGRLRKLGVTSLDGIDAGILSDFPEVRLTFDARDRTGRIRMHSSVTELRIIGARWIDFHGLERYEHVTALTLDGLTPTHLAALAAAPNIVDLHLDSAVGIDLAALAALPYLRSVTFDRTAGVDLEPLQANPRLRVRTAGPTEFWSA